MQAEYARWRKQDLQVGARVIIFLGLIDIISLTILRRYGVLSTQPVISALARKRKEHRVNIASPSPLPDDHVIQVLAAAHCAAYDQWVESSLSDDDALADANALARAMTLCPARSQSEREAKATVIRHRIGDSSMGDLMGAADCVDQRLVISYAADVLALSCVLR
jgi:hypothetical protein